MSVQVLTGDCREVMATLPDASVQCCVTSPPYWGAQRDYGVDGQLGMESTPEQYVEELVESFRCVRRVLARDGTLWLNAGDSYAASGKGGGGSMMLKRGHQWGHRSHLTGWRSPPPGYKQKDLVGVPWLLAHALRRDGWTLRRDVIWNKRVATEPPRMDRPSGSHEYLFLFSLGIHYQFDPSALPHGTVWDISPQGYAGHSAAFPSALVAPCVKASTCEGDLVLDPFGGAGTVSLVAERLGRDSIYIDLSPEYAALARKRIYDDAPMFTLIT